MVRFTATERAYLRKFRDTVTSEKCYDLYASTYENDIGCNEARYRNNIIEMSPTSGLWNVVSKSQEARFALQSLEREIQSRVAIARLHGYTDDNARALSAHPMLRVDNVLLTNDANKSEARMYECVERTVSHARNVDAIRAKNRERLNDDLRRTMDEIDELNERLKILRAKSHRADSRTSVGSSSLESSEINGATESGSLSTIVIPSRSLLKSRRSARLAELRRNVDTVRDEIKRLEESAERNRKSIAKLNSDEYRTSLVDDATRNLEQRYKSMKAKEYRDFGERLKIMSDESKALTETMTRIRRRNEALIRFEATNDALRNAMNRCLGRVDSIFGRIEENIKNVELYLNKEPHETVGIDAPELYRVIKTLGLRYPYAVSRKDVDETCRNFAFTWTNRIMTLRALDSLDRQNRETTQVVLTNVHAPLQFIAILYEALRKNPFARLDVLRDLLVKRIFPGQMNMAVSKFQIAIETPPAEFRDALRYQSFVDTNLIYVCSKFWPILKHADHDDLKYVLDTFIEDRRRYFESSTDR